jgi:membrane-associated protease RseP (regulator of RpoE activity)
MGTANRPVFGRRIILAQAVCLVIGMGVSLVPVLAKTSAFWGYYRSWSDRGQKHIEVELLPQSPASAAGLMTGDWILSIDGQPLSPK